MTSAEWERFLRDTKGGHASACSTLKQSDKGDASLAAAEQMWKSMI